MPRLLLPILLTTAAALAAASLYGSFRAAETAGRMEVDARTARREAEAARREVDDLRRALSLATASRDRLERELEGALDSARTIGDALAETMQGEEQAAAAAASRRAMSEAPVPFGVERCLQSLRECLRADGFPGMQCLRASALADSELRDVEFLDVDANGGAASLLVAESMTATLHRDRAEVVLRFAKGTLRRGGVRLDLPEAGHEVRLAPVVGRLWEERLPYLLRAEGVYAADDPSSAVAPPRADTYTRALWLERLEALLAEAGSDLSLRVTGFQELRAGEFLGAHVVGYERGNLLALTADCERLAVEVDARARVVSLWLRGGTLRRQGTESSIHAEGYRMLLPNLTPERATTIMTGMVVAK